MNINWCKKQNRGIRLIEANDNLAKEYLDTAEETLEIFRLIKGKSNIWLATTKYYCEYFCIYALLMKIGIKSEIHDCTIKVSELLEKQEIIPKGYSQILSNDKELRIENQYYLKNIDIDEGDNLTEFFLSIKETLNRLPEEKINSIRSALAS